MYKLTWSTYCQRGSHVFGGPKRTPVFSVAKDARNSPDVQACSPVQRFLRGWFCGIASTNSSHTIPANLTPVDSTVEAPPSLPLLCHSLTRLPHPHGAQVLVARLRACARSERAQDSIQCFRERLEPAAGGAVSAIEHPADGATGGARGRLVLRCSWLACERVRRAQRLDSVHLRASRTSRNRHRLRNRAPRRWRHRGRSGATGAQVLVHACERLTSDGRRVVDAHVRASRTDWCRRRRQDCLLPPIPAI